MANNNKNTDTVRFMKQTNERQTERRITTYWITVLWKPLHNAAVMSTTTQTIRSRGFLCLNYVADQLSGDEQFSSTCCIHFILYL